jgi:hypothetical protein
MPVHLLARHVDFGPASFCARPVLHQSHTGHSLTRRARLCPSSDGMPRQSSPARQGLLGPRRSVKSLMPCGPLGYPSSAAPGLVAPRIRGFYYDSYTGLWRYPSAAFGLCCLQFWPCLWKRAPFLRSPRKKCHQISFLHKARQGNRRTRR